MKEPEITKEQLFVMNQLSILRNKHRSSYFWKTRLNINDYWNKNPKSIPSGVREIFFDSFDKINAVFYHLQKINEQEDLILQVGSKLRKITNIESPPGVAGITHEPISYEFELFIMQSSACLEVFSRAVSICFKNESGFRELKKSLINVKKAKATQIVRCLEKKKYTSLMKEFIKEKGSSGRQNRRDYSVHFGTLNTGTINIPIASPQKVIRSYVTELSKNNTSPFGAQDLISFCKNYFYLLCDLIREILEILFSVKLEKGMKTSTLEAFIATKKSKRSMSKM